MSITTTTERFQPGSLDCGTYLDYEQTSLTSTRLNLKLYGGWYTYAGYWYVSNIYHSLGYIENGVEHQYTSSSGNSYSGSSWEEFNSISDYFTRTHSDRHIEFWGYQEVDINGSWRTADARYSITVPARPSYSLAYNNAGGYGTIPSDKLKKWHDESLVLPSNITRNNYTFLGWKDSSGASYAPGASYTKNAATTFTAQWKANNRTVSYNANGGSNPPASQTVNIGTAITISGASGMSRTGYDFSGWNTKANGSGTNYAAGSSYSGNSDLKLYAKWTLKTYTISYNANGGSGTIPSTTKRHGVAVNLTSSVPTRENYKFLGWSTNSSGTYAEYGSGASYSGNGNVTLYAIWKLKYNKPSIDKIACYRVDSNYAPSDDGNIGKVIFSCHADTSYDQGNVITMAKVQYKKHDESSWSQLPTIDIGVQSAVDHVEYITNVDTDSQYDVMVAVRDKRGSDLSLSESDSSSAASDILASAFFTMDFLAKGHGIAFGMPSNREGFLCNMNSEFMQDVLVKGTLTGNGDIKVVKNSLPRVIIKMTGIDNSVAPSSAIYGAIAFRDKNESPIAYVESSKQTSGKSTLDVGVRQMMTGSQVDNRIILGIDPSGNRTLSLSEAFEWQSAIMNNGRSIASNTNFNSITTPGVYYTGGASVSKTCPNCPTSSEGVILRVEKAIGGNYLTQICYGWTGGSGVFIRSINGSAIGVWNKVGGYVSDHVVAHGTNNFWTYRMWASGVAECWGCTANITYAVKTAWGSLYEANVIQTCKFPGGDSKYPFSVTVGGSTKKQLFAATPPYFNVSFETDKNSYISSIERGGGRSATTSEEHILLRPISATVTGRWIYHAKGRWK